MSGSASHVARLFDASGFMEKLLVKGKKHVLMEAIEKLLHRQQDMGWWWAFLVCAALTECSNKPRRGGARHLGDLARDSISVKLPKSLDHSLVPKWFDPINDVDDDYDHHEDGDDETMTMTMMMMMMMMMVMMMIMADRLVRRLIWMMWCQ